MNQRPSFFKRLDQTGVPLLIARLAVGCMFLYLGFNKFQDPLLFLKILREYNILPEEPCYYLNTVAIVLPCLEMVCGLALLFGVSIRGAACTIAGMLVFFCPALISQALKIQEAKGGIPFCDVSFDCGCGTGVVFICSKLVENTLLMIGAIIALISHSRLYCLSALLTGERFLPRWTPQTCPRCGHDLTAPKRERDTEPIDKPDMEEVALSARGPSST
jgi:uncharacterized membrane protein YphA (DoxX/SURF4 family)